MVAEWRIIKKAEDLPDACAHLWSQVFTSVAGYALRKTAKDNQQDFLPEVVEAVFKDFYADDLLKSFSTEEHAINIRRK